MEKKSCVCVFCKNCNKPFSVGLAEFAAADPDMARENKKYKNQGYRVELVENFDGGWCDCPKGKKGESKTDKSQMEMFI